MNTNNVGFAFVTFDSGPNGKKRPVLITTINNEIVKFLSITSQYANKSDVIKKQYYPIKDWQEIGLPKECWIDICSLKEIKRADFLLTYIGELTTNDIIRLAEFTENFNKRNS